MSSTFVTTILVSAEASISVILVLLAGYLCGLYQLLTPSGERSVSYICVHVFLPCLIITQMGPPLTFQALTSFWPIIALPLIILTLTYYLGRLLVKFGGLEPYIIPGIMFNNVTSLPLLMLSALNQSGYLTELLETGETNSQAMTRGNAYILMHSVVHNIVRFAIGPQLLSDHQEPRRVSSFALPPGLNEIWTANLTQGSDERHGLLTGTIRIEKNIAFRLKRRIRHLYRKIEKYLNVAVISALIALFIGVIPPFHYFVYDSNLMKSTFTQAMQNLGDLYPSLQLFALGVKLNTKPRNAPRLAENVVLFVVRFFLVSVFSIGIVRVVRTYWPDLWERNKLLDFILMVSPIGPPAITLAAIAELAGASFEEVASVSRLLLYAYITSPMIAPSISYALHSINDIYASLT